MLQDQYLKMRMNAMNGICKTDVYVMKTGFGLQIILNQTSTKKYINRKERNEKSICKNKKCKTNDLNV